MLATALRRSVLTSATMAATRHAAAVATPAQLYARCLSTDAPGIRRPKAIKVKKGEARRRVEPKPKADASDALVEQQEASQAPVHYTQGPFPPQQASQTFGGMLKESFLFGVGMALAFTLVGVIFMEETDAPGLYDASAVISSESEALDGE